MLYQLLSRASGQEIPKLLNVKKINVRNIVYVTKDDNLETFVYIFYEFIDGNCQILPSISFTRPISLYLSFNKSNCLYIQDIFSILYLMIIKLFFLQTKCTICTQSSSSAVTCLIYCRYTVKFYPINQSTLLLYCVLSKC